MFQVFGNEARAVKPSQHMDRVPVTEMLHTRTSPHPSLLRAESQMSQPCCSLSPWKTGPAQYQAYSTHCSPGVLVQARTEVILSSEFTFQLSLFSVTLSKANQKCSLPLAVITLMFSCYPGQVSRKALLRLAVRSLLDLVPNAGV